MYRGLLLTLILFGVCPAFAGQVLEIPELADDDFCYSYSTGDKWGTTEVYKREQGGAIYVHRSLVREGISISYTAKISATKDGIIETDGIDDSRILQDLSGFGNAMSYRVLEWKELIDASPLHRTLKDLRISLEKEALTRKLTGNGFQLSKEVSIIDPVKNKSLGKTKIEYVFTTTSLTISYFSIDNEGKRTPTTRTYRLEVPGAFSNLSIGPKQDKRNSK